MRGVVSTSAFTGTRDARRPAPDLLLTQIADYVLDFPADSAEARTIARYCLMDTLGCGMLALEFPACTKLLGPTVPGATLPGGARVPGTRYELDPVAAAFNIGTMIRWLDFNDTWLAAEWGHPSDNLGAILSVADYVSRRHSSEGRRQLTMADVLTAMIKAHEIQGVLALNHSFNRVGLDHVLLVRVASTAVATQLLGGNRAQIVNALSNAWLDGGALRAYRHAPNTGSRKSWAAGDATSHPNPILGRCFRRHTKHYAELSATPDQFKPFVEAVSLMMKTQPNYSARDMADIHVPVAIVQGEHEEFIKREHAEYLARSIPGAELIILPGVSHFAPLQRPEQFNSVMRAFLGKVPSEGR